MMHEVLLAGWGCPIGEFFYLEELAEQCVKEQRWTFFVTSEPCNVSLYSWFKANNLLICISGSWRRSEPSEYPGNILMSCQMTWIVKTAVTRQDTATPKSHYADNIPSAHNTSSTEVSCRRFSQSFFIIIVPIIFR
jgi:hypothetical protein